VPFFFLKKKVSDTYVETENILWQFATCNRANFDNSISQVLIKACKFCIMFSKFKRIMGSQKREN